MSDAARPQPARTAAALELLGTARIVGRDGVVVSLGPRVAPLVALVALGGGALRSHVASLLYPRLGAAEARRNLRQLLHKQRLLLDTVFELVGERMDLRAGVRIDATAADSNAATFATGEPPAQLLGDLRYDDLPELQTWLDGERAGRLAVWLDRLGEHAQDAERDGRLVEALAFAERLARAQPTSEHAHRRVMRLHYLRGDGAAALAAHGRCVRALADELGVQPGAETERLRRDIESASSTASVTATATAATGPTGAAGATPPKRLRVPLPIQMLRPPRMVGRDDALARLLAARAGRRHVLVLGEAGIGKSRLVAEFAAGQAAVIVQARPGDVHSPYIVLGRLVRALGLGKELGPTGRAELARIVPELGAASTLRFDRLSFEAALIGALTVASKSIDTIVVDDLQFADRDSIEACVRATAAATTPRLVFALRPADAAETLAWLRVALSEPPGCDEIALQPLGLAEVDALLFSLALPRLEPHTLAPAMARHTGGNPQFVLETVKLLFAENNAVAFAAGRLPLPQAVGRLIERRLGQLGTPALRLARVAAVAGSDFSLALAAGVLDVAPLDLADAWAELQAAAVFAEDRFAHDLVAETVAVGVPAAIGRSLHERIAVALAATGAPAGRVAEHWLRAGAGAVALPLLREAAAAAIGAARHAEAAQLLESAIAIECGTDPQGEFESLIQLSTSLQLLDRAERSTSVVERLVALAGSVRDRARAFEAKARWQLRCQEYDFAVESGTLALTEALAVPCAETAFAARLTLAQVYLRLRRPDDTEAMLDAARDHANAHAGAEDAAEFHGAEAWLMLERERFDESAALWARLADEAALRRSPQELTTALIYTVLCQGYVGDFNAAATTAARWVASVDQHGLFGDARQFLDLNLAYVFQNLGRYSETLEALQRVDAAVGVDLVTLHLRLSGLFLVLGQHARAGQYLDKLPASGEMSANMQLSAMLLRLRLRRNATGLPSPEDVGAVLRRTEAVAIGSGRSAPMVRWLLACAEFDEGDAAVGAARRALDLATLKGLHGSIISARTWLARCLLRSGDVEAALPLVRSAWALAETHRPDLVYFAEVGQVAHAALRANGAGDEANDVLRRTAGWIRDTAAHRVPAPFVDSFLNRNAVNRDVLAAASRLGVA